MTGKIKTLRKDGQPNRNLLKVRDDLSFEVANALLEYDCTLGTLRNKITRGNATKGKIAGTVRKKLGYVVIGINYKDYLAHRLIWLLYYGKYPDGVIDHIDRNPSNNRIDNLRDVSQEVNCHNQRQRGKQKKSKQYENNTSGSVGISWSNERQKWYAYATVGGKKKHIGSYILKDLAIKARESFLSSILGDKGGTDSEKETYGAD